MWFRKKEDVPNEIKTFNVFSPEREKLLCIGAAVTQFAEKKREVKPTYLKLYFPDKYKKNVLKHWLPMFEITTRKEALILIESWMAKLNFNTSVSPEIKKEVEREITKCTAKRGMDAKALLTAANKISHSGAFDIERLGYMIRVCFTLGFLTEEEAWMYLDALYEIVCAHFENWDEYIVSYTNENEAVTTSWYKDIMGDYLDIKMQANNIFDSYPIS